MKYHCDDCDVDFRRHGNFLRHCTSKTHKEQVERHQQDGHSTPKRPRLEQDDQEPQDHWQDNGGGDYYDYGGCDDAVDGVDDSNPDRDVGDNDEPDAWDDLPDAWDNEDPPFESDESDGEDEDNVPQPAQGVFPLFAYTFSNNPSRRRPSESVAPLREPNRVHPRYDGRSHRDGKFSLIFLFLFLIILFLFFYLYLF